MLVCMLPGVLPLSFVPFHSISLHFFPILFKHNAVGIITVNQTLTCELMNCVLILAGFKQRHFVFWSLQFLSRYILEYLFSSLRLLFLISCKWGNINSLLTCLLFTCTDNFDLMYIWWSLCTLYLLACQMELPFKIWGAFFVNFEVVWQRVAIFLCK